MNINNFLPTLLVLGCELIRNGLKADKVDKTSVIVGFMILVACATVVIA